MRKRFTKVSRCPLADAFWSIGFFWLVTSLPKNGQTKWAWLSQEFCQGSSISPAISQLGGLFGSLKGNKQNLYNLNLLLEGRRKITRLLPVHCSGTSHVHYMNVWNKMAITESCSFDDDVRLFPSVPEMKVKQTKCLIYCSREKMFLDCFQLGFGKRLIYSTDLLTFWN